MSKTKVKDPERAGALIVNKEMSKCLMVHQIKSKLWGLPKGRKNYEDEPDDVCMRREVKEEVGLELENIPHTIKDIISVYPRAKIFVVKLKCSMMKCEPPKEDGKDNHEIDVIEWVPLTEAIMRKTNSITRKAITHYMNKYVNKKHVSYENQMKGYDLILSISDDY